MEQISFWILKVPLLFQKISLFFGTRQLLHRFH